MQTRKIFYIYALLTSFIWGSLWVLTVIDLRSNPFIYNAHVLAVVLIHGLRDYFFESKVEKQAKQEALNNEASFPAPHFGQWGLN